MIELDILNPPVDKPPIVGPPLDFGRILEPDNRSLVLYVSIDANNQYAALDTIVPTLEAISFCSWICEATYQYIAFIAPTRDVRYVIDPVIGLFENLAHAAPSDWSWIDYYERGPVYDLRLRQLQAMTIMPGSIESIPKILRLELVSFQKINPSVFKIVATGTMAGVLLLSSAFGAVHLIETVGAQECRQRNIDLTKHEFDELMRQSRREGKLTEIHERSLRDINKALNIKQAACGSSLENIGIELRKNPDGTVDFIFGVSAGKTPGRKR